MMLEWQQGIVVDILDETPRTKRYFIQLPATTRFDFKPGQFVTLDLPIHEKKNKRWRSYSIASAPNESNIIELVIELVNGGLGTTYLWEKVHMGDELKLRGPAGVFVLHESVARDCFMICTGTGIAPFRSMIQHIANTKNTTNEIYLIVGARSKEELLYFNEMTALQTSMPNFHYIPTLSREEWKGHTGHVHPIYKEYAKDKPDAEFFLCGWKEMIDEAKQHLLEMGYDKKQIHLELYG
jgi:ferredoxin-NADP reductase